MPTRGERAESVLALLDSTVLIDYLRGCSAVERVHALRERDDIPATSAINVDEIVRGLRPGEEPAVRALVDGLIVLPIDTDVAWTAGHWRRSYADRGVTLWQADCLIAATARHNAARLCTGNPEDFPMPEVSVEHWPAGV